ncbi:MAG: carbohydrate porin [Deltaproteobacteria bacterium]|nr:carbohydrate porin [Deltaproteobacteria bacterium]
MRTPSLALVLTLSLASPAALAQSTASSPPNVQGQPPVTTAPPSTDAAPRSAGTAGSEPPAPRVAPPDAPVSSDTSAPSVPGRRPPPLAHGNDPARTVTEAPSTHEGHFEFGSYGRVWAATDLRGGLGRGTNVVAFGPRIVDEGSYAELELRREDKWSENVKGRVVATLALFPPFFHFTGNIQNNIGVRNLYAQGTYHDVTMWAGSRMYRGDDIYLLNWWPLDNQNTVGGGIGAPIYKSEGPGTKYETILQFHMGQQRLDNAYQVQQIPVVAPFGFGTVDVTKLDRPRTIETVKLTQFIRPGGGPAGFKAILYGELHQISAGTFQDPLTKLDRGLPQDSGFMLGSQLTYFTGVRDTYASLVMRHARGIAAYDPLAVPITFALDRTVSGASETQVAFSTNFETEHFAILGAAYVRFFRDGSPAQTSTQKYDEGTVAVRPSVFLGDHFGVSVEGSYQARRMAILQPNTEDPLSASVAKVGVMPYFSPSGKGSYKRPQIRMLYVASFRNSGARSLYAEEDVFFQRSVDHYIGLGAEWWFNSSSYP